MEKLQYHILNSIYLCKEDQYYAKMYPDKWFLKNNEDKEHNRDKLNLATKELIIRKLVDTGRSTPNEFRYFGGIKGVSLTEKGYLELARYEDDKRSRRLNVISICSVIAMSLINALAVVLASIFS